MTQPFHRVHSATRTSGGTNAISYSPETIAKVVRVLAWVCSGSCCFVAIQGFVHLTSESSIIEMEDQNNRISFGGACLFGLVFAFLLFLSEFKNARFFYLFGFLRYRVGRMLVYLILGVAGLMIGQSLDDLCKCHDYKWIDVIGGFSILLAICQVAVLALMGNNPTEFAYSDLVAQKEAYDFMYNSNRRHQVQA